MKKYFVFILLLGFLIIQPACMNSKNYFHNRILIYSSVPDSGQLTQNAIFIDFYKDTINKINYPFSLFENDEKVTISGKAQDSLRRIYTLPNIYPYSGVPFKFSSRGKFIYISYSFKDELFQKKYFHISNMDSVETSSFEYLCDTNYSGNWVKTHYLGDTIINISRKRIKCWIFHEAYPYLFPPNQRASIIYLSKKTFLPIQINTIFYRPIFEKPGVFRAEVYRSRIDSVFKRPWSSITKKWNYPKCFKTGYTSME